MKIKRTAEEKRLANNAAQRKWKEANREKHNALQRERDRNNPNKPAIDKAYRESKKDGYFTVYYLPEEHYVGQTNSLYLRLTNHRKDYKRHILDAEVLGKFETRKEALAFEAKLHLMGYNG